MMNSDEYTPYLQIASKLKLQPGDWVMVSADISRLAFMAKRKEGSFEPQKFIRSLYEAIQPGGTLIIPTYNFLLHDGDTFDIKNTRPVTGTLAIEALKMEGFKRTKNPLHSFAVMGKGQEELCTLENVGSFDANSPFALMHRKKAKALIIGLDIHSTFTFAHYVEEKAKVTYRYFKNIAINYIDENGIAAFKNFKLFIKFPWIRLDFHPFEIILKPAEIQQSTINNVNFRLVDLEAAYNLVYRELTENKARKIAFLDLKRGFKEITKGLLRNLGLHKTLTEKIQNVSDL